MNQKAFDDICRLFDERKIEYRVLHHPPCHTSAESAAARARAGAPEAVGAKAILMKCDLKDGKEFITCVLPGPSRLDSQALKESLPDIRRMRFATPEEMRSACGVAPGCMPPFAAPIFPQISRLFIDHSLLDHEWLGFNAAQHECSIVLRAEDYARVAEPTAILHFALATSPVIEKEETSA